MNNQTQDQTQSGVTHNPGRSRFEIPLGTEFGFLDYRLYEGKLALMHTLVPMEHEGHGYAGQMAKAALEYARSEGMQVLVYCPFVSAYLERHPEYKDLAAARS